MAEAILRRYTDLPALLDVLYRRRITLLDPSRWDDRNDSYYLELYAAQQKYRTVLALCFTRTMETYHHWKIFANGASGVSIIFNKARLIKAAERAGVEHGPVEYRKLEQIKRTLPEKSKLPYLKRWAFQHECEYRLLYTRSGPGLKRYSFDVPIPENTIQRVVLSPWMHASVAPQVIRAIKAVPGFKGLKVDHSSLINNDSWKAWGDSASDNTA